MPLLFFSVVIFWPSELMRKGGQKEHIVLELGLIRLCGDTLAQSKEGKVNNK